MLVDRTVTQEDILALSNDIGGFTISHHPSDRDDWFELLIDGLAFDLSGLSCEPRSQHSPDHCFDVELAVGATFAKLTLSPGPHIAAAQTVPGVNLAYLRLLMVLSKISGAVAVGWQPANSLMSPTYFQSVVSNWEQGGPFPALGITALRMTGENALRSEGLAYFTGQEVEVELTGRDRSSAAKLAVRAIDYLVERGAIQSEHTIESPDGGYMLLSPDREKTIIRILT